MKILYSLILAICLLSTPAFAYFSSFHSYGGYHSYSSYHPIEEEYHPSTVYRPGSPMWIALYSHHSSGGVSRALSKQEVTFVVTVFAIICIALILIMVTVP